MFTIKNYSHLLEIYNVFYEAGTYEEPGNLEIKVKMEQAVAGHDIELAQSVLDEYPWLYEDALLVISELEKYEEHWVIGPPPEPEELSSLQGQIPIGEILPNGQILGLDLYALIQMLVIYGVPGTGKTWMIIQILRFIFKNFKGIFNVIIFDSKRDYIHLLREFDDLIALRAKDVRYNVLEEKEGWLDAAQVICDENYFGGHTKIILEDAYRNCLIRNGVMKIEIEDGVEKETFTDSENYPNFTELSEEALFLAEKLKGNTFYEIKSKLEIHFSQYARTGKTFNCKKGFPLEFWRTQNIIIDKGGVNNEIFRTFTASLIHRLMRYNRDNNIRCDIPVHLFVGDEADWWLNSEHDNSDWAQSKTREDIFRRGREFGIAGTWGFQQPNIATKQIRRNVRNKVTFQIESDSLTEAQIDFALTNEQLDYLAHELPEKLVGIFKCPRFNRPILFQVADAKPMAKNVTLQEAAIRSKPIRSTLEKNIIPPKPPKTPEEKYEEHLEYLRKKLFVHTKKTLHALWEEPYLTKTQLLEKVGGTDKEKNGSIKALSLYELIEILKFRLKTKPAEYFPLTIKAHDLLKSTPEDLKRCPRSKYFIHRMVCDKITDHLKTFGLDPIREFTVKDLEQFQVKTSGGEISPVKCRIDVAVEIKGKVLGYEFMSTDLYYVEETLIKCMKKMRVDELIIITKNANDRKVTRKTVKETEVINSKLKDKVTCLSTKEFFTKYDPIA